MKNFFLVILGIVLALSCFSEEIIINEDEFNVDVISSDDAQTIIEYNFGSFERIPVEINGNAYFRISLDQESKTFDMGNPELPKITRSIIIPDDAKMKISVLEKDYIDYQMKIVPSKGILYRDINPADVPYDFSDVYQTNDFYPQNLADSNTPYILRDFRGLAVHAYPFAYNPVTQTLRVYHHLVLEVNNVGIDNENIKIRTSDSINKYFEEVYNNHFINFSNTRYTSVNEHGRMLVICYDDFMSNIQPYVDWKNQKGIDTELQSMSSIGTTAADILAFVQSEYDEDNDLTFVQLVGDAAEVPPGYSSYGDSDPSYALLDGSDGYPDIFVGRFSAEELYPSQLDTQVERTVHYERDIISGTWLSKAFGVASDEGTGDDNEYDYEHIDNIRTDLLSYNYTVVDQIYDPGASASQVSTAVNEGRSFGTYCGHGSNTSWSTTGFSTTSANALANDNKLPFICDVACVNGNFDGLTCFAEAWMRATNGGNPTGAIAIYASTINQSWDPPMAAQDEVADLLCGTGPHAGNGNQNNSIGGLMYNGSCLMLDEYNANDMYQTWTIFGDASLQVRTEAPSNLTISHDANIFIGQTNLDVSTGVEGTLVCLSDTTIVASGYTNSSGNVTLNLDPFPTSPGNLTLTVTGYNKITSVETIPVTANDGPFVSIESTVVDAGGDDVIEYGETVNLTVTLSNNGTDPATNVNMALTESDSYITLSDAAESFGTIAAGASVTRTTAYTFTVSNSVPDAHAFQLDGSITSTEDTWNDDMHFTAYAPILSIQSVAVVDGGNGRLDPDETADLVVTIENSGGAVANNIDAILSTLDSYITINDGTETIGAIAASSTGLATFNITTSAGTPMGHTADFNIDMTADLGYSVNDNFSLSIGLILDDFETGNFASFPWENAGNANWTVVTEIPQEGTYCTQSGDISSSQTTELILVADVTIAGDISFYRKVSSESSYDYFRFFINDIEQGSWSGEVAWSEVIYSVSIGTDTEFKWVYEKDGSVDGGSDCAWVDYIVFPTIDFPDPSDINVTPLSFSETLDPDSSTIDNLIIENLGEAQLDYSAIVSYVSGGTTSRAKKEILHNEKNRDRSTRAYCDSYATSAYDSRVDGVQFSDVNTYDQPDQAETYTDWTHLVANVEQGLSYDLTIWGGDDNTSTYTKYADAFFDWNQDDDFDDAGERVYISTTTVTSSGPFDVQSITIPNDALLGQTRMRVIVKESSHAASGCDVYTYGETEDYTINILDGSGMNWLTLDGESNVSSTIVGGDPDDVIAVGFDSTDLEDGIYEANIIISSNDPDESSITVPATLTIDSGGAPEPEILIDPTSLSQDLEPDQIESQTFEITNNGDTGTTLSYNISWDYTTTRNFDLVSRPRDMSANEYSKLYDNTRDETWLDINPISGVCTYYETDQVSCDFNSTGLADGVYTATITITNNADVDKYVYVNLTVDTPIGTTPVNPRAIAEFEPVEGVLVRYPFGVPVSLIAEMSEDVMVTTIVANASEETAVASIYSSNGVNMTNTSFEYSPTDSYWIRDFGPWWVEDGSDDVSIADFTYNRPRPNDNNIPGEIATYLDENIYLMGFEHTGGNYMTDGMGVAASTELIWDENPSLSQTEINQIMADYLGIHTYQVVPDPNNTYIDHIDCWSKFLDVDKILIREVSSSHAQYSEIESAVDYFEAQTSSYGTPYEIYRVYTENDEPYTNSIILNNKVFVPIMDTPSTDNAALAVYEAAMPGYEIHGFYDSSWESTDAIHCRLRGIANRDMLHISHVPISGTISNTRTDYEINATIVPYSEQPVYNDSIFIYYKVTGGSYSSVLMSHQGDNNYQGVIPEQAGGSEISYYIHAADQSGQSVNHPFIGESDPHLFNISGILAPPENINISLIGMEVTLTWDAVYGATSYIVYRSENPYNEFPGEWISETGITGTSWSYTTDKTQRFYRITAE